MHTHIVCGILLIVPTVYFALAAPVLVQEKRQACADSAEIAPYYLRPKTVLEKRVISEIEEVGGKYIENWFKAPEKESAAHASSSSASQEGPSHESSDVNQPLPPIPKVGSPAPRPDYTQDTQSAQLLSGMHAPQSSTVLPIWFHPENGLLEAHAAPPNPSTELDSNNRLVVEKPPSLPKGLPTESDYEMVDEKPSGPVSSADLNRESMSADSPLENFHTYSDVLKGQAKGSRRNSDTARDVGKELQREVA